MPLLAVRSAVDLQCNASLVNGTGLNLQESISNVQSFCQSFASQTIGTGENRTTTYKPLLGNSNMQMSITLTDDCGSSTTYTIDQTGCQSLFYRLLDSCPTQHKKGALGYYGGTIQDACATYTLTTEIEEQILCGSNPYHDSSDIYIEAMNKAIHEYCSSSLTITPNFVRPNGFQTTIPHGQSFANAIMEDGLVVKIVTQFNELGQEGCSASKRFSTKGSECTRRLEGIRDRCGAIGGVLRENGANGCVAWTVWGRKA
ncbi:Hypothetical predicted protein [Lecanosticta acicola]|uniref:Uncharacterized protein n=1 Tax=Lecanosticta acicola TaxID=111012 RepID=A0AAI9ECU4_9PEZI|nr:Hypothetical predicted protein [Lecanosticta acicola]